MNTLERRRELVKRWAVAVNEAAVNGHIVQGKAIEFSRAIVIAGPRAGVVKLQLELGFNADKVLPSLKRADQFKLNNTVPWEFTKASAYMEGRFIRLEADWPPELADTNVTLSRIGQHPKGGGSWIAGISETGNAVVPRLDDVTPTHLVTGEPGAGKSMALQAAVLQLSRDDKNEFILIDGKFGQGLKDVSHIKGMVGPLASDFETGQLAISYALAEMQRRYNEQTNGKRLILIIDEIQPFIEHGGPAADMIQRYVAQGRAVDCFALLGTWYPLQEVFGKRTTKPLIPGKIALHMKGDAASRVIIGASWPRTGNLAKPGDSYVIGPNALHRAQLVNLTADDFKAMAVSAPKLDEWPPFNPEAGGTLDDKQVNWGYTGGELGCSVLASAQGNGRRNLTNKLNEEGFEAVEGDRVKRLSALGKEAYQWLQSRGWALKRTNGGGLAGGLPAKNTPKRTSNAYLARFECLQ